MEERIPHRTESPTPEMYIASRYQRWANRLRPGRREIIHSLALGKNPTSSPRSRWSCTRRDFANCQRILQATCIPYFSTSCRQATEQRIERHFLIVLFLKLENIS